MSQTILKQEERVAFALRSLYRKYGYLPYKMSKFEAYDLYVANKEFLLGDGVITFNDTDGKLLALKPDVTMSIVKNCVDESGTLKVYYNENVYRISGETKQFKELMQVGVECIGEIGVYEVYETVCLAAKSLAEISEDFVLDVSHLGVLKGILKELNAGESFAGEVMRLAAEKNLHETRALCEKYGVEQAATEKLLAVVQTYGEAESVLVKLAPLCKTGEAAEAFAELKTLCSLLKTSGYVDKIRLDFSVVNDMKYYNGIVFKGFVDGVCEGVLSGGRYDGLTARMGKSGLGAIGFAVYLDLLEGFRTEKREFDVDTLVLYDEGTDVAKIALEMEALVASGLTARAQKSVGKLRVKEIVDLRKGGVQ